MGKEFGLGPFARRAAFSGRISRRLGLAVGALLFLILALGGLYSFLAYLAQAAKAHH